MKQELTELWKEIDQKKKKKKDKRHFVSETYITKVPKGRQILPKVQLETQRMEKKEPRKSH